jgi:hypothetical protein
MPLINPSELRRLVAALDDLEGSPGSEETLRRREDLHYTLCVSMGIREPAQAVEQARRLLAPGRDSLSAAA